MRKSTSYILLLLVGTLWTTLAFILPDFLQNPVDDIRTVLTIAVYLAALAVASLFVLLLGTIQKHVATVFLPLFAMLGSTLAYYRIAYHATLTPTLLDATLHTNTGTIADLISIQLVGYVLLNLGLSIGLVYWRWRIGRIPYAAVWAVGGLILLPAYHHCNNRLHVSINQRYPYNVCYTISEYLSLMKRPLQIRDMHPFRIVEETDKPMLVVVIGEAIRADHLSINGYERNTTPRLEARSHVLSLGNVNSIYSHTAASIPHMLTPADSIHMDWAYSQESFVPYLQAAGYRCCWISNQDMGQTYAHFIQTCDSILFLHAEKSVFVFDRWVDGEMLTPVREILSENRNTCLILHTIGAHWYYGNHVPEGFAPFTPTTTDRVITHNKPDVIINSYDNCVAYLDIVLDSLCTLLEEKDAVLIYQSDHGESLGENGHWLHAGGAPGTLQPAGLIWYSDLFAKRHPKRVEYYEELANKSLQSDYLFPCVLHTAGIEAEYLSDME